MTRYALAVAALVAITVLALAQQAPEREPAAIAVANRALATMGAADLVRLSGDQLTFVASGTYVQHGSGTPVSYPFRVKVRGWERIRWETDRPDGTVVTLVLGDAGWSITPDGTTHILGTSALVGRRFERLPFLALAQSLASSRSRIQSLGSLAAQGGTFHRLMLSRPSSRANTEEVDQRFHRMSRCEVDIDAATSLPARLRYFEHPGDARIELPMDLVFTDYGTVQGVQVPLTVTRFLRNQRMDEFRFQAIQFFAPVPDSDFVLEARQ